MSPKRLQRSSGRSFRCDRHMTATVGEVTQRRSPAPPSVGRFCSRQVNGPAASNATEAGTLVQFVSPEAVPAWTQVRHFLIPVYRLTRRPTAESTNTPIVM